MKNYLNYIQLTLIIILFHSCAGFEVDRDNQGEATENYAANDEDTPADRCDSRCQEAMRQGREELNKGTELPSENHRIRQAVDSRDIILGMSRSQVQKSWGEPNLKEVSGDGSGGHERWRYGNRYSLQGERTVIFENGHVAGWYH